MSTEVRDICGLRALVYAPHGPLVANDRDVSDLLSDAFSRRATQIVIPAERLHPDFFLLRTGLAGLLIQKLVNYRRRLAVVGDISPFVARSNAFRDFVYEANKGGDIWFVADLAELEEKLARRAQA